MSNYDVDKRPNYDGLSNWCWVLWIDDYAWDSYATEAEAWAAAEQHHAGILSTAGSPQNTSNRNETKVDRSTHLDNPA